MTPQLENDSAASCSSCPRTETSQLHPDVPATVIARYGAEVDHAAEQVTYDVGGTRRRSARLTGVVTWLLPSEGGFVGKAAVKKVAADRHPAGGSRKGRHDGHRRGAFRASAPARREPPRRRAAVTVLNTLVGLLLVAGAVAVQSLELSQAEKDAPITYVARRTRRWTPAGSRYG